MIMMDEADKVRDDVIRDLRTRLTWAYRVIMLAALAGILGGAALAPLIETLITM